MLWYGRESSGKRLLEARNAAIVKQEAPIDDASVDQFFKERTDPTNTAAWQDIIANMVSGDFLTSFKGLEILGLSQVPTGYPMVVPHIVAIAMDHMAIVLLKDAIEYDVLNEVDLQLLLPKIVTSINISEDWKATIAGERGFALQIFNDPSKAKASGVSFLLGRSRDALRYMELSDEAMAIAASHDMINCMWVFYSERSHHARIITTS